MQKEKNVRKMPGVLYTIEISLVEEPTLVNMSES